VHIVLRTAEEVQMSDVAIWNGVSSSVVESRRGLGRWLGRTVALIMSVALMISLGVVVPSPADAATVRGSTAQIGERASGVITVSGSAATAPAIAAGFRHTCALLGNGTVNCWGDNDDGLLGDGTETARSHPVKVLTSGTDQSADVLGGVTQIAPGYYHTCALLEDQTVRCWGSNFSGELGNGERGSGQKELNPVKVLTEGTDQGSNVLGGVLQIAAGLDHTCALLEDRTVRCWGYNGDGQLGDGTTTSRSHPVKVLAAGDDQNANVLSGVTQIATREMHVCALLEDETVRCWGYNTDGALGDGTRTKRKNPVNVLESGTDQSANVLGGVIQIAAGGYFTCALLEGGTVRCWGYNDEGQLGDGTLTDRLNPVKVLVSGTDQDANVLGGVTQIGAGGFHTCGLLEDRTVRCWGDNDDGELGDGRSGSGQRALNPVKVLTSGADQGADVFGAVTQISPGGYHTCALLEDLTARCWGYGGQGQLGDGEATSRSNPVRVLASGTVTLEPVVFLLGVISSGGGSGATSQLAVECDGKPQAGRTLTCTVTGGDPGIDILWRAAYNPPFAGQGVTLDADGVGTFGFTVPAAALGQVVTVELVDWLAPVSLGVVGGPVPTSVPSGGGPVPVWSLVLLALAGGLVLRRMSAVAVRG
jgi:alpha-tubulin suppressor-like RCC1 family protein